jgi:ankyrin repeat protein
MITADKGYLNSMRALVEVGGVNVNTAGFDRLTPMHLASRANFTAGISYLRPKGADLGPLDKDNMSPLHHAAINGATDTMHLLVDLGARRGITDRFGSTPLDLFEAFLQQQGSLSHNRDRYDRETREEIIGLLTPLRDEKESKHAEKTIKLEKPEPTPTPKKTIFTSFSDEYYAEMFAKIKRHDPTKVAHYIQNGGDPNYEYPDGYTLLTCLAERGLTEMMETVINAGADVNKSGKIGLAPIHLAATTGNTSGILLLHKKGANIELLNGDGSSPLHQAALAGRLYSMITLLRLGANYNKTCCSNCNVTPSSEFVETLKRFSEKQSFPADFQRPDGPAILKEVLKLMDLELLQSMVLFK